MENFPGLKLSMFWFGPELFVTPVSVLSSEFSSGGKNMKMRDSRACAHTDARLPRSGLLTVLAGWSAQPPG